MAEFHKNQIMWQAPEAQKVTLAKPDLTPLANALNTLGQVADDVARSEAGYLDNRMVAELNTTKEKINDRINNADSLDANYEFLAKEGMDAWDAAFNSFDEATKSRFLRANPNAREEFALDLQAKTLKKQQDQIYNRSKLDIAQWSSDVINAPMEQQDAVLRDRIAAIQNLGLPIQQTDDLVFRLRSEIDDYSIAEAIANGRYAKAQDLIKNGLPTKGASQRAQYMIQLQNAIKTEARERAERERLMAEAKEEGQDLETAGMLEAHQKLLAINDLEGAGRLRDAYYAGADIPIYNEKGDLDYILHSSSTSAVLRDKIFNKMKQAAERAPANKEYFAQYQADFNRLSAGFVQKDGSLKIEEGKQVSPEQYVLASDLRKKNVGWKNLDEKDRTFVDNVLRSYGNETGLYMLDLNPNTTMGYTNWNPLNQPFDFGVSSSPPYFGIDYKFTNPVVNFQTLMKNYSSPADVIAASIQDPDNTYAADTLRYWVDDYSKKFTGEYELENGSRAKALTTMFVSIATKNNPNGMDEMQLQGVPRAVLEDALVRKLVNLKQNGVYEADATYQDLIADFKDMYKYATGREYQPAQDQDQMQKYTTIAYQATIRNPSLPKAKDYDVSLTKEGRAKRKYMEEMSKQAAESQLKDKEGIVSLYEAPTPYVPKEGNKIPSFGGALVNSMLYNGVK